MINKYWKVETNSESYPFGQSVRKCKLEEKGYVEEEYFFNGTANVYKDHGGKLEIKAADAPYVNRMIVRRPASKASASGRVIIEILNATSGMDIDRMWVLSWRQIVRNGDTYIGITSKPSSVEALKKYNLNRYGILSWRNPVEEILPGFLQNYAAGFGALSSDTEAGLFWDMLEDVASDLREERFKINDQKADRIYLTGWSQSTGYLIQYIKYFAYRNRTHAPFDGYFAGGGVKSLLPGLNQTEIPPTEDAAVMKVIREPYILLQTESENNALGNDKVKVEDSDDPEFLHRTYEIPGATHDSENSMTAWYHEDSDLQKMGIFLSYPGKEPYENNYPDEFVFHAAYQKLIEWAEEKKIPERFSRIHIDMEGRNIRDRFGNTRGGWRLPMIDVPVCTYYRFCTDIMPNTSGFALYGCRYPFDKEKLKKIYGSLESYKKLVTENAEKAVKEGRLLGADLQACICFCIKEAQMHGLE